MAAPTPPEIVDRILSLHRDGQSMRQIAAETGVNPSTVARWIARHALRRVPAASPQSDADAAALQSVQRAADAAGDDDGGAAVTDAGDAMATRAPNAGDDEEPLVAPNPLPRRLPGGNRRSRVLFGPADDYFDPDEEEDEASNGPPAGDRRDGMNGNGGRPPIVHDVPNLQEVDPPQDPHTIRVMLDVPLLHAGIWEALTASDGYDGTLADLITETFAEHFGECLGVRLVLARMPKKSEEGEDDHAGDAVAATADPA